jgi:hypothetical protein
MTSINLESLGIGKEELIDRVVSKYVEHLRYSISYDEDGEEVRHDSSFDRDIQKKLQAAIDARMSDLATRVIEPRVEEIIAGQVLQRTTQWGEKVGAPVTLTEYLVQRADAYMSEKVDWEGKSKDEKGSYSWTGSQTRLTHLIDRHLQHAIAAAAKEGLANLNASIATSIAETVKMKLQEAMTALRLTVTTK